MRGKTQLKIGFGLLGAGAIVVALVLVALQMGGSPVAVFVPPAPKNSTVVPVLTPAVPKENLTVQGLQKALRAADRADIGTVGAAIVDVGTGKAIVTEHDKPMIPASTLKTVTSVVALDLLGPDKVFRTRVVQPEVGQLILVGGGDPYLRAKNDSQNMPESASLEDLAQATAAALKASGTARVKLHFDEGLFSGPNWHKDWTAGYDGEVPDITALWADKGHAEPKDREKQRAGNPRMRLPNMPEAEKATRIFADHLRSAGVKVDLGGAKAAGAAPEVAGVDSLPLDLIVKELMLTSDNAAAELLFRHIALVSERPGTFADGAAAVKKKLQEWELWREGMVIRDGSGLSKQNRISPSVLALITNRAMGDERLRPAALGMPVAASTGTLVRRYDKPNQAPGRGVIHAKTGFVNNTNTLVGYARTKDGAVITFALMLNDAPLTQAPVVWLDQTASELAKCGC